MTDALARLQATLPPRHWLEVRSPVVGPTYYWERDWKVSIRVYDGSTRSAIGLTLEEACDAVLALLGGGS